MGQNKVAKLVLSLTTGNGVAEKNLNNNYPDFLDFDGDLITYINSNTVKRNNIDMPWTVNTRQSTKMVRVIRRILTNEYLSASVSNSDIEQFVGEWQASLDKSCTIEVLKGWDILKAFNYYGDIDMNKFARSCANFRQHEYDNGWEEPKIKWFYFYIYNDAVSVAVVKENGIIKARSVMFTGEQVETNGDFKEGEIYTYMNGFYTEGSNKYLQMIRNWGQERGYLDRNVDMRNNRTLRGSLIIPIKTHYKTYPPVDSMYADMNKNLLVSNMGNYRSATQRLYKLYQNGGRHGAKNQ